MLGKPYKKLAPSDHAELMRQVREAREYYLTRKKQFEICVSMQRPCFY